VLAAVLWLGGNAHAQYDYVGTRAQGMGEALRANASGASALLLNPAGMSLSKGYVIEAGYGLDVENLGHHAFVGIVDSVTSRVAAGLFYEYIHSEPKIGTYWAGGLIPKATAKREGHAAGLSLSMALGERFLLGATLKYLHFNTDLPLPEGTSPSKLSLDALNGVTFDVGAIIKIVPQLQLGVTGQNLWNHNSSETPSLLGLGLSWIPIPALMINFDGVANFTGYRKPIYENPGTSLEYAAITGAKFKATGRFGPGIEWLIAQKVPLRGGFIYDTALAASYVTVGTGYFSHSFAIDASYRAKVSGGLENYVMVGIRIFIN
jgi:hypothetical protein